MPLVSAAALCLTFSARLWAAGVDTALAPAPTILTPPPPAPPVSFEVSAAAPAADQAAKISEALLNFDGVNWPPELTPDDRTAFEAALNISGSFEGGDAWSNLTGNFDGEGMSMGLLNQCLGQGSLQPLLIRMREEHPDTMAAIFSPAHLLSLFDMLDQWQGAAAMEAAPATLHIKDEPLPNAVNEAAADKASVAWAVANLYAGPHFDPLWKQELKALASHPQYVSYQIDAALRYHEKAVAYEAQIGVREFRAYLFLFDIVVQDGSLYPEDLTDYAAYVQANPAATDTQKLEQLLTYRLRHVRSKFVQDVQSRKLAIITGSGNVHGLLRNLPYEYSYDPLLPYR